jgi:hypothetical protein
MRIVPSDSYFLLLIFIFYYCSTESPATSAGIATGCGLEFQVRFPPGQEIFLFLTASRPALGPTQPLIQWVQRASTLGQSGRGVKLTTYLRLG